MRPLLLLPPREHCAPRPERPLATLLCARPMGPSTRSTAPGSSSTLPSPRRRECCRPCHGVACHGDAVPDDVERAVPPVVSGFRGLGLALHGVFGCLILPVRHTGPPERGQNCLGFPRRLFAHGG